MTKHAKTSNIKVKLLNRGKRASQTVMKNFLTPLTSIAAGVAVLFLGTVETVACPVGGATMSKVELYFGLNIPGGGRVEHEQWQTFIDKEVTPRFPDGLTIDEVSGQWRDVETGNTIREPSRALTILYKPSVEAQQAIEDIRAAYKLQFQQDSVMRLDETNCVSF